MLPPYSPEEVAGAVRKAARAVGCRLTTVAVVADDRSGWWTVVARLEGGRELNASYPFSTAGGITVPAEIAAGFSELAAGA